MLIAKIKKFVLFGNIARKSVTKGTSTCTTPLLFLIAYSGAHRLEMKFSMFECNELVEN